MAMKKVKPGTKKKVARKKKVLRFRGIDRSLSKAAYKLESKYALLQRETGAKNGGGEILQIYRSLSPSGKRFLLKIARSVKAGK